MSRPSINAGYLDLNEQNSVLLEGAIINLANGFRIQAPNVAFKSAYQRTVQKIKEQEQRFRVEKPKIPIMDNLRNIPTHNLDDTIVEGSQKVINTIGEIGGLLRSNNPLLDLVGMTGIGQISKEKRSTTTTITHTVPTPTEMNSGGNGGVIGDNVSVNNLKLNLEKDLDWDTKNLKLEDDKETFELKHSGKGKSINTDLLTPVINLLKGDHLSHRLLLVNPILI